MSVVRFAGFWIDVLHIGLLLAAVFGAWLAKSRTFLVIIALLILPLPAALVTYFNAPSFDWTGAQLIVRGDRFVLESPDDCGRRSGHSANGDADDPAPKDAKDALEAGSRCQQLRDRAYIFFACMAVNYLAVFIGFATGLLAWKLSNGRSLGEDDVKSHAAARDDRR